MFSVVYVYLDHLCVVCVNGRKYVCCGECDVVCNECNPPPALYNLSIRTVMKLCMFWL